MDTWPGAPRKEGDRMSTWPFPIGGPPPQARGYKQIPFHPNNPEDAPW